MSSQKNEDNIYLLSELLKEGACLRCINNTCKFQHKNNVSYPDKICRFVKNPTLITGVTQILMNANLDFNGKEVYHTICNYINGNCKNCIEGRKKKVLYNNNTQYFYVCYPNLNNSARQKITVGIHFDIKILINANETKVSILPYQLETEFENNNEKKNLKKDNDVKSLTDLLITSSESSENGNEKMDFMTKLKESYDENKNKNKKNTYVKNMFGYLDEENVQESKNTLKKNDLVHTESGNFSFKPNKNTDMVIKCLESESLDYNDNSRWPIFGKPLSVIESPRSIRQSPSIDYSRIKKTFENEVDVNINTNKNTVTLDINDHTEKRNITVNLPKNMNVNCSYNTHESHESRESRDSRESQKCEECIKCKELIRENRSLKIEIDCLKDDLYNTKKHIKNEHIYTELVSNLNELNTRVSDQFLKTDYSEYQID